MKRTILSAVIYLSVCHPSVSLALEPPIGETWQGKAQVRFLGTSTLHGFSGTLPCESFKCHFLADPNTGKAVVRGEVDALVQKMDTKNKKRDKNMRKMFDAKNFPRIHVAVRNASVDASRPTLKQPDPTKPVEEIPGYLPLTLTIRDKQKRLMGRVRQLKVDPKKTTFTVDFDVSLKAFGLKRPNVLGLIRVGDRVRMQVDVTLSPWGSETTLVSPKPKS